MKTHRKEKKDSLACHVGKVTITDSASPETLAALRDANLSPHTVIHKERKNS